MANHSSSQVLSARRLALAASMAARGRGSSRVASTLLLELTGVGAMLTVLMAAAILA